MAIGLIFDGPGVTQAQYDQVNNEVAPNNTLAAGQLYHAAGPSENGWCVIQVWESQEAIDTFFQEKLGQALQKANITAAPKLFQVHHLVTS